MMRLLTTALVALWLGVGQAQEAGLTRGPKVEFTHPGQGHEVHLSGPALAVDRGGTALVTWAAPAGADTHVYVARAGADMKPVRVNPSHLSLESLHQPPAITVGPGGEIYVTWSSRKPIPAGGLFASDLRLSRSLDGGQTFEGHLRVNEDRPISHSFDGLAATADGTLIVAWIDSRDGPERAGTYVARVGERGTRVESVAKLDDTTCVCCRVSVTAGPSETVAVAWRRVFPGDIRDMVVGLSRDGGRSFAPPALVHADRWRITACPHRGGPTALDRRGRHYMAWYTEGTDGQPRMLFATAADGQRFGEPRRLNVSTGSIPDQVRLAVTPRGDVAVVWEDATAVRRRVLMRYSTDGGRTLGPVQLLSQAIKAYAPDVAAVRDGEFVVAWHEEQFPRMKTVIQSFKVAGAR